MKLSSPAAASAPAEVVAELNSAAELQTFMDAVSGMASAFVAAAVVSATLLAVAAVSVVAVTVAAVVAVVVVPVTFVVRFLTAESY